MVELTGLTKRFFAGTANEVTALDGLSLALPPGDFVTVIGPNGAGKSTLLKAITGVVTLDAGRVVLDGRDVTATAEHRRARLIGRVDQDPQGSTAPMMSIEENLAMAAMRGRARGLGTAVTPARRDGFRALLAEVALGLEDRLTVRVGTLSGGQRQALALLMATMGEPRLLLLDEHTASLDPRVARQVMEITDRIVTRRRLTTLMVTHNMEQAIRWGSRLVMMSAGRMVLDLGGREKQGLGVADLVERFQRRTGEVFAEDRALLVEPAPDPGRPIDEPRH
jgi:putative tryptophan/tyrosine transport system ATP-binding protein